VLSKLQFFGTASFGARTFIGFVLQTLLAQRLSLERCDGVSLDYESVDEVYGGRRRK
jgi:hypothetical protein